MSLQRTTNYHRIPMKKQRLESWLDFPLENCRTLGPWREFSTDISGSSATQQTRATSKAQVMPPKKPKTSARPEGTTMDPSSWNFGSTNLVYHSKHAQNIYGNYNEFILINIDFVTWIEWD